MREMTDTPAATRNPNILLTLTAQIVSTGSPITRWLTRLAMSLERFLVRYFDFSLVTWAVTRAAKVRPVPTALLTTTGRKSGRPSTMPMFYFPLGKAYYVIASKGGAPDHPDWFKNLATNPDALLCAGRREIAVRARIATGQERERLWKAAAAAYPPYDDYQRRAKDRQIPVVVLEPV
jgi:deazaflavin-dependent oxidoreductase (nitroreductase family)